MLVLLFTTTFIAAAPRMSEEAFLAKWSDVLSVVTTDELMGGADRQRMAAFSSSAPSAVAPSAGALGHHRQLQGPPPTPGSNPFAMLIAAIQQITGAWQSIVNAFKSSYSEEISDKEFANGWSKFKESTKVFKGAGLEYAKTDEFFTDIQSMISIPADYKDDFNQQVQWIKFFDNLTWSEHNTQFNQGKGGSDTMFTMYARNREADQKIDVLFLTIGQEFKLADNYFVISESKSILGGIFSSTELKFKKIPAGISTEQLMFVSDYFSLLAYQQIALAEGIQAPPDPSFPPTPPQAARASLQGNPSACQKKMQTFCPNEPTVKACYACLHEHTADLRPECEGTGSGQAFCRAAAVASEAPPDWVPLLELTLANYALTRANTEPEDFLCTTKGMDHDNCNCWNDHGDPQPQDHKGDCKMPQKCWMYSANTNGYFNYTKMPNSTASLHQTLALWSVPSDMYSAFDAAALVESATFASFHLDIKNDKGHFDAHVGTLRNYQGSFYVGYTAGSADGDLVRPLERHQKAIDAVGGADPGTVICQFFDMKKRGYTDKEIILIQNGLQAYAYKKAASMVPQAAKKSLPAAAAEQAASDEATSCDARSLISRHEGKRQCVYKDTRGIPTIGIGYNLENPGARSAIAAVGADYESILSGKTCLADSQVMQLFEPSYQSAVSGAQRAVSSFGSLCCNVAEVMIDMDYNLGDAGFASFGGFIGYVNSKSWSQAAADGRSTAWCGQVGSRCSDDIGRVASGC